MELEGDFQFDLRRDSKLPMCNLYSHTSGPAALRAIIRSMRGDDSNMPPLPFIYPDTPAPIVRNGADGVRELAMARWGMPTPPKFITGKADRGVTNVRNLKSSHWRQWLKPEHRCVVPATAFAEPAPTRDPVTGKIGNVWFGRPDGETFVFAGIWTKWSGVRKVKDGPGQFELFAFLTTEPNSVVAPIHPKAMPVILTTPAEIDIWMTAPPEDALKLQRPLADSLLKIVEPPVEQDETLSPKQAALF